MAFDVHEFVVETNLIDQQPSFRRGGMTVIYPAYEPGQQMYDNTVEAFGFAMECARERRLYLGLDRDIHRLLTRGIDWFETQNYSGHYRDYDVEVGDEVMPEHWKVEFLMRERWLPQLLEWRDSTTDPEDADERAWWAHHCFECIHPFADGNGRTGRILLNYFRVLWGLEPITVYYEKVRAYYAEIQWFREYEFGGVLVPKGGDSWPV
jgi:Fic family protein